MVDYVETQDDQKPVMKGWQIVINGKRTTNVNLNNVIETAISVIKLANACTSGNLRFGIISQNKTALLEMLKEAEKFVDNATIVDAAYDHPDVYAERSGI